DGRMMRRMAMVMPGMGYAMPSTSPARMKRVRPRNASRATAPAGRSDRSFGVVVLVLMAVVARIVVLVARGVDLVEDDGGKSRRRGHDRFERALGEPAARHLSADDERHAVDERRENHGVRSGKDGRRVE